jgi:hypothetical protein
MRQEQSTTRDRFEPPRLEVRTELSLLVAAAVRAISALILIADSTAYSFYRRTSQCSGLRTSHSIYLSQTHSLIRSFARGHTIPQPKAEKKRASQKAPLEWRLREPMLEHQCRSLLPQRKLSAVVVVVWAARSEGTPTIRPTHWHRKIGTSKKRWNSR